MSTRLTLRGLTRHYPGSTMPALSQLDLTVPAGGCLALLGPSGSGKTTVLRLASGLDQPDAGDVLLDGRSVLHLAPEHRGMTMVFQRPLLFPHCNVWDNVAFAARVRGVPRRQARAQARDYLDLVHLGDLGHRRPSELSGGQQQRVAVARALAAEPRVLLLDEPFSALDAPLREEMHELVRQIRESLKPTIVLVTHDQHEAAALADEVAVLCEGRLVQQDTVERIYTRPLSLLVARQMGGRNEVPGEVVDGHHHSVLGNLALPVDVRPPRGSGLLVFRQESVDVVEPDDVDADACGTVTAARVIGARRLLTIRPDQAADGAGASGDLQIHAETAPGHRAGVGARVGFRLSPHALAVVPGPSPTGEADQAPALARTPDPSGPAPNVPATSAGR